ncbi:hypothetical protein VTN31DRAFT_2873 [Thermomyces dupontii]|uniref:uncharacterized protein n=1 Tax=Talaromyces thermophilus TaxID=28565 RepID=UPI003744250F
MATHSSYVDLTNLSSSPPRPERPYHRLNDNSNSDDLSPSSASNSQPPRGVKRRRIDNNDSTTSRTTTRASSSSSSQAVINLDDIEAVDLTEVNDANALSKALSKQREDAIKAQQSGDDKEGRTILTATKCAICMDTPTDATSTACGHLFCHQCIMEAIRHAEQENARQGRPARAGCPACRRPLSQKDRPGTRRDLIPLQFKLATKKRTDT